MISAAPVSVIGNNRVSAPSEIESALILGDVIHIQPELLNLWPFGNSGRAMQSVQMVRDLILEENLPCVSSHFPGLRCGHVVRENGAPHGRNYKTLSAVASVSSIV